LFYTREDYRRVGPAVAAARLQVGGVLAAGSFRGADQFVPPEERLYAGGPNSVRGYNQNQLGPVVYIVRRFDTDTVSADSVIYEADPRAIPVQRASPTGGNSLIVGNLELRTPSPFLAQLITWAFFVDVGQVYNRSKEAVNFQDFKWTPGLGVRVASPVGPVRLDVAYNGYPRERGAVFFVDRSPSVATPGTLRCVSPGNRLNRGVGGDCPATFAPPPNRTFFSRLTFHFSIGQAF
jgi:outer membrane protein insertion porin family/translocation and assembly module TamA